LCGERVKIILHKYGLIMIYFYQLRSVYIFLSKIWHSEDLNKLHDYFVVISREHCFYIFEKNTCRNEIFNGNFKVKRDVLSPIII